MFGYVKKNSILTTLEAEVNFNEGLYNYYDKLVESLMRDGASSTEIENHTKCRDDYFIRMCESVRLLTILKHT